jgi:hypothetical protein
VYDLTKNITNMNTYFKTLILAMTEKFSWSAKTDN